MATLHTQSLRLDILLHTLLPTDRVATSKKRPNVLRGLTHRLLFSLRSPPASIASYLLLVHISDLFLPPITIPTCVQAPPTPCVWQGDLFLFLPVPSFFSFQILFYRPVIIFHPPLRHLSCFAHVYCIYLPFTAASAPASGSSNSMPISLFGCYPPRFLPSSSRSLPNFFLAYSASQILSIALLAP